MKILILFLFSITFSSAQVVDYNTKKGVIINGYDVVSYFKGNPLEGKDTFTFKHQNVTFKFSSKDNLDAFKSNPEKYIPQYGGYCAYAIAKNGKKVKVDPKTYAIINDKLYLFYNAWGTNTLELWNNSNNVKGLIHKADQTWEASKKKN